MESHLPAFKDGNPQLDVVTELIRAFTVSFFFFFQ